MRINLSAVEPHQLDDAIRFYEDQGYLILDNVGELLTKPFRAEVAAAVGIPEVELDRYLDPHCHFELPSESRRKLSRIESTPQLSAAILHSLGPLFQRLLGPLVHVSSTFHLQLKSSTQTIDHGGYANDYSEIHMRYLLHQDFTAASIPTSPSGITLWLGMNSCPNWNVRIYPRSHKHGLLCRKFVELDDPAVAPFGSFIDFAAHPGTAIVFHALMLHGTSNPGPLSRASCDIRFFPLCAFLPSQVHKLCGDPARVLREGLETAPGPIVRSPLLEDLAYLGSLTPDDSVARHSILNWANYIARYRTDPERALADLEKFVNRDLGWDDLGVYSTIMHGKEMYQSTLAAGRKLMQD